ncbi:host specificity factor TipJ family phage tail protein [Chitinasiproducens palmae]|uniref:Phage-related protein, tail component n=1 Tax=Chitinasiproducens palmae TaxID=1770053 RepID=A0A1H2PSA4_9BURK|nr:host specificity factor TipJ family phage tail protein [Chitinasiproducens palmae]SDV49831.1 Phage-related protein, tail component [Chitinasiproducens palmae]
MRRTSRFLVYHRGEPMLQRRWTRCVEHGDALVVAALPGNGGGSNPLATVLTLALVMSAPYLGGVLAGAAGTPLAFGYAAGIGLVGSALINAVLPPKSSSSTAASSTTASPTYTIAAQGNSARIGAAIPRLYGRFRVYPDYAAQPYTENVGNEQYLYQLFCVTLGEMEIEQIRIGDTDISSYGSELQYEVIEPGGTVTLFPDNVVTSADVTGLEAVGSNERPDDAADSWTNVLGPFTANPATTTANVIGIDVTLPQGLAHVNDDGNPEPASMTFRVQARAINDSGAPVGDWYTLDERTLTMATIQPQMLSFRYSVPDSRVEVYFARLDVKRTDSREINTMVWSGMRAYLPSQRTYGNVTMIAMIIRATNNLNSNNAKQVNVIGTGKVPVWDGSGWSAPQATRSIAWAIADMCRNADYGAGMEDTRLPLAELQRLDGVWAARGETLDGVFDTQQVFWEALTDAARVGRARPMYYAGVVEVVRDEPKTLPTAMFTPYNMVAGSWKARMVFPAPQAPDCVDITYTDPTSWQPLTVRCALAGSPQAYPQAATMFGITSRDQAYRLGMYMAACNRDQRVFPTLKAGADGYLPKYGDLVSISHDVPGWGQSGEIIPDTWEPAAGVLTTSEPLTWTEGANHYIGLRTRTGGKVGPFLVERGDDDHSVRLVNATLEQREMLWISDGYSERHTHYTFGPSQETESQPCIMLKASPDSDETVELSLVNYAASVYEAENQAATPPPPPSSQLLNPAAGPVLASLAVAATTTPGLVTITSPAAHGATAYEYWGSRDGGATWQLFGQSAVPSLSVQISTGAWRFRGRAIGVIAGPFVYQDAEVGALVYTPGAPGLALQSPFTGTSVVVNIVPPAGAQFYTVVVTVGGVVRKTYSTQAPLVTWSIDDARNAGAVSPEVRFQVSAVNAAGESVPAFLTVNNNAPPAPTDTAAEDGTKLAIDASTASDVDRYYIRQTGTTNPIYDAAAPGSILSAPGTSYDLWVTDVWGNTSPVAVVTTPGEAPGPTDPGGGA